MRLTRTFPMAAMLLLGTALAQNADPTGIRVPTVQVGSVAVGALLELDAVLEPVRQATVTSQVGGNVLALRVAAGDTVRRGQALVQIDDREVRANTARSDAAVVQAQSELRNAQQVLERNRSLQKSGFLSAAALDSAENQVKSAQASVAQAQAARNQAAVAQGFAALATPFDAVVLTTHVQTGDLALPGRALVTIYQPGLLRAVTQVPASRVALVNAATQVDVVLPDGRSLTPTARDMQPTADPMSQTVEWRLPLPPATANLRPGQMVRVLAQTALPTLEQAANDRVSLPVGAVLRRGELTAVYVAAAHGFVLRAIRVGPARGDTLEVVAGLRAGERVALDPVRAGLPGAIAQ